MLKSLASRCVSCFLPRNFAKLALALLVLNGWLASPAFADDPIVDSIVSALTTQPPELAAFKNAMAQAQGLTAAQAAQVATQLNNNILNNAQNAVTFLLNVYTIGSNAGPNPFVKILGKVLANAVNKAFAGLIKVFKDPLTNTGKLLIVGQLEQLGFTNVDATEIVFGVNGIEAKIYAKIEAARLAAIKANAIKANSISHSLMFDASTGQVTFGSDEITSVVAGGGPPNVSDPIVGASVTIPMLTYDGYNPEGNPGFSAQGGDAFSITNGSTIFLQGSLDFMIYIPADNSLIGPISDVCIAGASPGSVDDCGLPDTGSSFDTSIDGLYSPSDYLTTMWLEIIPSSNLIAATDNFQVTGSVDYINYEFFTTVDEPNTITIFGIALIGLAIVRRQTSAKIYTKPRTHRRD